MLNHKQKCCRLMWFNPRPSVPLLCGWTQNQMLRSNVCQPMTKWLSLMWSPYRVPNVLRNLSKHLVCSCDVITDPQGIKIRSCGWLFSLGLHRDSSRGRKFPKADLTTIECHNSNYLPWNRIVFEFLGICWHALECNICFSEPPL